MLSLLHTITLKNILKEITEEGIANNSMNSLGDCTSRVLCDDCAIYQIFNTCLAHNMIRTINKLERYIENKNR